MQRGGTDQPEILIPLKMGELKRISHGEWSEAARYHVKALISSLIHAWVHR
jgi:hypothetical protein